MVKQHKLVNECLKEDIKGIHGLQVGSIETEESLEPKLTPQLKTIAEDSA